MKWNSFVLFFIISLLSFESKAQTRESILVVPDSTWGKETFEFPISFAPELAYSGYEEAWFPKNWIKKDSAEFWSYAFAWKVKINSPLTGKTLQSNLKTYFDGLMKAQSGVPNPKRNNTEVMTWNEIKVNGIPAWKGKIKIFDAFSTGAPLDLFFNIEQVFSREHGHSILLFRFSPKQFEHGIWKELNNIQIQKNKP